MRIYYCACQFNLLIIYITTHACALEALQERKEDCLKLREKKIVGCTWWSMKPREIETALPVAHGRRQELEYILSYYLSKNTVFQIDKT